LGPIRPFELSPLETIGIRVENERYCRWSSATGTAMLDAEMQFATRRRSAPKQARN
jgi:hypothetical protein